MLGTENYVSCACSSKAWGVWRRRIPCKRTHQTLSSDAYNSLGVALYFITVCHRGEVGSKFNRTKAIRLPCWDATLAL